jgi:hypothetical protein
MRAWTVAVIALTVLCSTSAASLSDEVAGSRKISPALQRQMATPTPLSQIEQQKAEEQARMARQATTPLAQLNTPYADPDQQLLESIERRAVGLFPWAGQEDQRRQYVIDEMRAAANRRQGNSYSIHVTR